MVEVLRHSGMRSTTKVIFKNYLNSGAVYFETPDKSRQWIISLPDNASSRKGGEIVAELRRRLSGKNIIASDSELIKAAEAIKGTAIKHSDQFDIIEEVPDELIHSYEPYVSNNPHVNGPNSTVRNLRFTEWDSKFLENTKYGPACRLTYYYKPGSGANIPIDYYKGWTEPQIQNQIKSTIYGMFDKGTITITPGEIRKGATFVANKFREYEAKKANSRPYSTPNFSHSLFSVVRSGDELYHHGVKGQRWGVVHEDERTNTRNRQQIVLPSGRGGNRQSVRSNNNGGHSYYSPNTGNSSQYNRNPKSGIDAGKNNSVSQNKEYTTPDFSTGSYSNSSGVYMPIKLGNTGKGIEFGLDSDLLRNALDNKRDIVSYVKGKVISQLESFQRNGVKVYLTDEQIDMVVWRLVYEIEKWKKNNYTPIGTYRPVSGVSLSHSLLSVPVSALSIQSNYVGTRNIVDIADSDKISKEEELRRKVK